jgi:hypothetical protein
MSPRVKREYFQAIHRRYKHAIKKYKSKILDEFCQVCGYNRKYAIDKLNNRQPGRPKNKPGKPSRYNHPQIIEPLKKIWLTANLPCSKRLVVILPLWLPFLKDVPDEIKYKLLEISASTIDRILKPSRAKHKYRGFCATKPGTLLRKSIPIKVDQWNEFKPGFLESDTVHHCGSSLLGQYAITVDTVDIASGWTEARATWGLGHTGVVKQIKDIKSELPFKLLGFDADGGSEFMNQRLVNYFKFYHVQFTRSRSYQKNDNAHIEQKNWTHVRQWLGYYRFADPAVVPLLNDLYKNEWRLFHNFFLPSVKLIAKDRVGSKTIKKHDTPKSPYQRLMESVHIDAQTKFNLTRQFNKLNPFELRAGIETKLKAIFKLASSP